MSRSNPFVPRTGRTAIVAAALVTLLHLPARGGTLEVTASDATPGALTAAGFNGLNGNNISVGVEEAGNGLPLTTNPFLPNNIIIIPPQLAGQAAQVITNHGTEVTGQIVATVASGQAGIAPGALIQAASYTDGNRTTMILNAQAVVSQNPRAHILNMSFGTQTAPNNGLSNSAAWVDWAASSGKGNGASPSDNLFVVAGNEGTLGVPSDAYNAINVGSTGIRNGAGNLVYTQGASYQTTNVTGDTRTLTATAATGGGNTIFGRMKTDLVAPGGDPGPAAFPALGTFNAPPAAINQFLTTSGQRYELNSNLSDTVANGGLGYAVYATDDINNTNLTGGRYIGFDNTGNVIGTTQVAGPPYVTSSATRPAGLGGADALGARTIAGTSFAAPLVSGAAALLEQYGTAQGMSIDHRVIKALLLNGASKLTPDGTAPLLDQNGAAWAPALNPLNPAQNKIAGTANKIYTKPNPLSGPIDIKIGLDPTLGTGQLDVVASLKNYSAGRQGPGVVRPVGWDLNSVQGMNFDVPSVAINDYKITAGSGGIFSATLTWDRIVSLVDTGDPTNGNAGANNGIWDPNEIFNATNAAGTTTGNGALPLTDLDLELWNTATNTQIDFSTSDVDNVEHIYTPLGTGTYDLYVIDRTLGQGDNYALAWSLPEPSTFVLLALAFPLFLLTRRGQRRRACC